MEHTATHYLTVEADSAGMRLDAWLAAALPELSRARIQALLREGCCTRPDGSGVSNASLRVRAGESYCFAIPPATPARMEAQTDVPFTVLYEDASLLVIDKPAGVTVHPAPGNPDRTLVNGLLAHCGDSLSGIGGVARPGIVHRLDKETSGLMVVAKDDEAHHYLAAQLKDHSLARTYRALAWDTPRPAAGSWRGDIGRSPRNRKKMAVVTRNGKPAVTHYRVLERFVNGALCLLECRLETGRTHQIRVHASHHGHPLIGDPLYGAGSRRKPPASLPPDIAGMLRQFPRQALHACGLAFIHPETGETRQFSVDFPSDLRYLLDQLRSLQF